MMIKIFGTWVRQPSLLFLYAFFMLSSAVFSTAPESKDENLQNAMRARQMELLVVPKVPGVASIDPSPFTDLFPEVKARVVSFLDHNSLVRLTMTSKEGVALVEEEIKRRRQNSECLPINVQCPWLHTTYLRWSLSRFLNHSQKISALKNQIEKFINYCQAPHYIKYDSKTKFYNANLDDAEKVKRQQTFEKVMFEKAAEGDPIALEFCLFGCARKIHKHYGQDDREEPMLDLIFICPNDQIDNNDGVPYPIKSFIGYACALEKQGYRDLSKQLIRTFTSGALTYMAKILLPVDPNKAVQLYKLASKSDYVVLLELGDYYFAQKNYIEAKKYFEPFANRNISDAPLKLGMIYAEEDNLTQAAKYLRPLADNGNEKVQWFLGKLYFSNNALDQAMKYLTPLQLGSLFAKENNLDAALVYLQPLADQGNRYAKVDIGNLYLRRNDFDEAKKYLGAYELGQHFDMEDDLEGALKHLQSFLDEGAPEASRFIGKLYLRRKNFDQAMQYLQPLIDADDEEAPFILGEYYANDNDVKKAEEYLLPLIDFEDKDAQLILGKCYVNVNNIEKAKSLLKPLAEEGIEEAQILLGKIKAEANK